MTTFTTIFTKETDGGYTAQVLELPGCISYGETMEEAQTMIKEATIGYLEAQKSIGNNLNDILNKQTFISSMAISHETV